MLVEMGNEKYEATIDEQNSVIIVDDKKLPIINAFGYTYKLCKRPLAIGSDNGAKYLHKSFANHLGWGVEQLIEICRFVKQYGKVVG